ncbi:MAG TPA: RNA methyltransferase [Candidatus Sulfotelmatobacter sp.]|jgi:TrmH RNA methyltransferase|nr:RNA methyltransferase [Candidatus Sulfotelmatobacter sp.]
MSKPPPRRPTLTLAPATSAAVNAKSANADSPPPRQPDLIRVAGLPAVQALFAQRGRDVERLFYEDRFRTEVGGFCKFLAARRKPYRMVETDELTKVAGTPHHGGIVAVARPRPMESLTPALARSWADAKKPLLLLDGVGNPHNLGAIIRSMAFFGLEHLIVSEHPGQAGLSESAHRVAEGGLDWVSVHRAPFPQAVSDLATAGYRVIGTALEGAQTFAELPRDKPLAILLGNEETGVPDASLKACSGIVKLPGSGHVQSLNVAATAAILIWELAK